MPLISDTSQNKILKRYNINIKTKYISGNNILERNTNNSQNDDIKNGIISSKEYYLNDNKIHEERKFDSRIEYTYISKEQENQEFKCPNCGMVSIIKDFIDGCPYCRTIYNIDYTEKDMGSKYHYDRVLRSTTYRTVTAIIDLVISIILSFIFIKFTSRTFNEYDISKIFIYGFILAIILYYFFYVVDGYIVLGPIKRYKDKQNQKQIDFWKKTGIDKSTFFNNLNYEIALNYFNKLNIIDYDIIDFDELKEFTEDNTMHVKVKAYVRIVYYKNGKISSKYKEEIYIMRKMSGDILEIKEGINYIKCNRCGSSIDATKGECEYCHSKINYLQEWILEK